MLPFREHHFSRLLEYALADIQKSPSDVLFSQYVNQHKSLGSKDRKFLGEEFFFVIRNYRYLKEFLERNKKPFTAENILEVIPIIKQRDIDECSIPIRYSLSEDLWRCLRDAYGEHKGESIAKLFLEEAPLFLRMNRKRNLSGEELLQRWADKFEGHIIEDVPGALVMKRRYPIGTTKEYLQGFCEIQDLSSQKVSLIIPNVPGVALDYCAGAGGKTLGLAEKFASVLIYDIRKEALQEALKRAARGGHRHVRVLTARNRKNFKGKCSLVVADVPCSGSGTYRRHPEQKWLFSQKKLREFIVLQQSIVEQAREFLKPQGIFVYVTCSILPQENEFQRDLFLEKYGWKILKEELFLPEKQSGDGMFVVVFQT